MPHRWDDCAGLRSRQIENGLDLTFSQVFVPYLREALRDLHPASVLEVGGGTGHLALELVHMTETYLLIEPSSGMFERALRTLEHTPARASRTALEDLPVTDKYDLVLSHMCVHTIEHLDGFFSGVRTHLAHAGSFIVSLPHPAFYNDYKAFIEPDEYCYMREHSGTVSFAPTLDPAGYVEGVPYHHRPISTYSRAIAGAGLCITDLHEVWPPTDIQDLYGVRWKAPRYLAIRGEHRGNGSA